MKTNLFKITLLLAFFMYGFNSGTTSVNIQQETGFMDIMHQAMSQMEQMKMTGDPDYDFAMMMSMHHNAGIKMLDQEIKSGKKAATKRLAKKIRDGQEKDLQELQSFVLNHNVGEADNNFMKEMKSMMQKAKDEMNSNMNMSNNIDKDFVMLMSMHHQHGINLAQVELQYGRSPQMKDLAQKMINDLTKEKDQLDKMKE